MPDERMEARRTEAFARTGRPSEARTAAHAVYPVGRAMDRQPRRDAAAMHDRRDVDGTERCAFAGRVLRPIGASRPAHRLARGHFDVPMPDRAVAPDGRRVVVGGKACRSVFEERVPG